MGRPPDIFGSLASRGGRAGRRSGVSPQATGVLALVWQVIWLIATRPDARKRALTKPATHIRCYASILAIIVTDFGKTHDKITHSEDVVAAKSLKSKYVRLVDSTDHLDDQYTPIC
jgi:hypothetical protein